MQGNNFTLERHTGRRPGRTHDGVVIALRSNVRWCSDHLELACRNGIHPVKAAGDRRRSSHRCFQAASFATTVFQFQGRSSSSLWML
jgi:hypothetical protein